MSILRFIPELPLLRRELIELSNRRRTYIVRFVGAIVVLSVVMVLFQRQVSMIGAGAFLRPGSGMPYNPNRFFGSGGVIFQSIVPMLFHAVQLLMPALICGSITLEKERNTLGTLFVTRLSPMTIVLEKLGSRLVPMFTFLLLTFPLLAFVYSLGGVDTTMLISTLWLLFCECLLYACIGLMCSSWFATTVTAFIWSYVLTGLLVMSSMILRIPVLTPFDVWQSVFAMYDYQRGASMFMTMTGGPGMAGATSFPGAWQTLTRVMILMVASLPSLIAASICLLLARVFLIRRAFLSSSSILLRLFKWVDRFFTKLNDRTTGGVVLIKDRDSLPLFDPVSWRERSKKSLGKARYLIRILVVLEGPILVICLFAVTESQTTHFEGLQNLLYFMWGMAALIIAVKASTLISSERARETLEALLSTPLTAREILTQKIAGTKRLMMVLAIPVLTIHFTILIMHFDLSTAILRPTAYSTTAILAYGVVVVLTTWTVMHLIAWISVLLGMRSQSQSKSVMTAITVIATWVMISAVVSRPGGLLDQSVNSSVGFVFSAAHTVAIFVTGSEAIARSVVTETIAFVSAFSLWSLQLQGGIEINEYILSPASGSGSRLSSALATSFPSAMMAAFVVLIAQFLLMRLIQTITLRLAPRLLQRRDQKAVPLRRFEPAPDALVAASEVIA